MFHSNIEFTPKQLIILGFQPLRISTLGFKPFKIILELNCKISQVPTVALIIRLAVPN